MSLVSAAPHALLNADGAGVGEHTAVRRGDSGVGEIEDERTVHDGRKGATVCELYMSERRRQLSPHSEDADTHRCPVSSSSSPPLISTLPARESPPHVTRNAILSLKSVVLPNIPLCISHTEEGHQRVLCWRSWPMGV